MAKGIISGSMNRPVVTIIILLVVSFLFATRFPKMKVDTDPENMLEKNEYVRVWNTPYVKNIYKPQELNERRKLKALIDPDDIMNPGKLYFPPHLFLRKPFFSTGMNTLFTLHNLNPLKKSVFN